MFADSPYAEATVSIKDEYLEIARGEQHDTLEYWNASDSKYTGNSAIGGPSGPTAFIRFDVSPGTRVTGVDDGLAPVVGVV